MTESGVRNPFKAFRIHQDGEGVRAEFEMVTLDDLTPGEVVIEAHYSGINYKDALAATGKGKILRRFPLIGGVDVSGVVVSSSDPQFQNGDAVLVSGSGLSELYDGGYAEYVRVPSQCVVSVPHGLSLFEAMVMGTPALTAALALHRMQLNGQRPEQGPIVVTGASGGVGNLVVDIFARQGYQIIAVTSKPDAVEPLMALGAQQVKLRDQLLYGGRPLEKALWAGAVDMVGGETLAWLTRTVQEWGNIAAIGLTGGSELHTTVMPFILRGVSILGISSTNCPAELRRKLWLRLAQEWKPAHLGSICHEVIDFQALPGAFEKIIGNHAQGRIVVNIK